MKSYDCADTGVAVTARGDDRTVRIEARFKNARLYNAIAARAFPATARTPAAAGRQVTGPIKAWCVANGLSYQSVYGLLAFKKGPVIYRRDTKLRRLRPICVRLATLLDCDVAWLFPAELYETEWNPVAVDVKASLMLPLAAVPRAQWQVPAIQEAQVAARELRHELGRALDGLTPRQRTVILRRFGLGGRAPETLREIATEFGLSAQQIRVIEAKALRRLRHPMYSRRLSGFLE